MRKYHEEPNPFIFLGYPTVGDDDTVFCIQCSSFTTAKFWTLDSGMVICPRCKKTYTAEEVVR